MPPTYVDIGVNLTHDSFDPDREAVIDRARAAGVTRMIVTGADLALSRAAIALAAVHPRELYATAGIHPHQAADFSPLAAEALGKLLDRPEVVAAGECGLDYFRNLSPRAAQRRAFSEQIALAIKHRKPLFLHQRDAHEDWLAILDEFGSQLPPTLIHCFTGNAAELDDCLARNFYVGITGWICDERRGRHLLDLVKRIPCGRLMLETDAPYLLPRSLAPRPKTRRNEPAWLPHIAEVVAQARGETPEETAVHTSAAAVAFFRLDG